ncbi:PaaI family thioesterase [uncultured Bacteroides sp.]|uniref:PaaI family thioesterase n=1 Tax=uncultured Bacteroides sp. TaxID=162156 RepID=UPI00262FE835|nr:PaaI family thioesterase [uncultured Bacteroides sp.]
MKKLINPWKNVDGYFCFGCAPHNPYGLKMEFYEDGDEIVSYWKPEKAYQGWLNTMHGGVLASMLDEICGWVVFRKLQTAGVTSKMETRYLKPVHTTEKQLTLKASLREQRRNIAIIDAAIYNEAGEECTTAVCTYFTFPKEKAQQEMFFHHCKAEGEE